LTYVLKYDNIFMCKEIWNVLYGTIANRQAAYKLFILSYKKWMHWCLWQKK